MNRIAVEFPIRLLPLPWSGPVARTVAALAVVTACVLFGSRDASAANPPTIQVYYVALPEDDLLTLFDADDEQGGTWPDASSPLRSITSISIADTGTIIYYDQWEDGGYEADIANPGGNTYDSGSNPDGTQIWGDGILANGCPPSINNSINPCTLASHDQLAAGQIITLDNDVVVVTNEFQARDEFGAVSYSNNNGANNWLGDWTEVGDPVPVDDTYHDAFGSAAYNLSTGTLNWATNSWVEENDDGSATTGTIYVNTGEAELRFRENSALNDAIRRQANLSGYTTAILSFELNGDGIDATGDAISVEVSGDGGSNYTELATFNTDPNGATQTYDISAFIASNTVVRFIMRDTLETGTGDGERWDIDDVDIALAPPPVSTGDILITSNQLRFSETETSDSLTRSVNVSGYGGLTLSYTLGGTNLESDGSDELVVQVSTNGTTYTTVATHNGATSQTAYSINLNDYVSANTRIRFSSLDALEAGEFYTIDDVEVTAGFGRDSSTIYFDGRDKVGVTSPIAMTRLAFPISPGSVMAGAAEVLDTTQWGTYFVAPVGEDTPVGETSPFEDVRWFVMAQTGGATIDVDANGDGDLGDANDLNDYVLAQGGRVIIDGINEGGTLTVVSGNAVQVHNMMADVGDTFEFRWDALIPRDQWSGDYYSPVGTDAGTGSEGCTEVWIYNPATAGPTQTYADSFTTQSYSLSTGTLDWTGNSWTETGDTGGPTGGDITIQLSSGNRLSFNGVDNNDAITRVANLSGYTSAQFSFDFADSGAGDDEDLAVQVRNPPAAFVTLEALDGTDTAGTYTYDISAYIDTDTEIRFLATSSYDDNDIIFMDNVQIALSTGAITVNIDRPGGGNPDATLTIPAQSADEWPGAATDLRDEGFRLYTTGGEPFLPVQIVDCTKNTETQDGRLFDWGAPLIPADQLTDEVVVGYAAGCSNESYSGICHDPDSTVNGTAPDLTTEASRSVVWVTALANTTIYVDTNGSGITCPGGAGAEQTQAASALVSYRFDDDPSTRNYVHDLFTTASYSRDDTVDGWNGTGGRTGPTAITWTGDWTEGNGETGNSPTTGAIQINTTTGALRLQELAATSEAGRTIQRQHNISGNSFARLSFRLSSATTLDANDRMAVEISGDGGTTWTTLETFTGPYNPNTWPPTTEIYNITPYIATNTVVRFRFVDDMETGDYWQIDNVHIDYVNGGDYDMTASRIKTCDGTLISVAYGQDPEASGGNDEEAQDFGTLVPPFRQVDLLIGSVGDYVWVDEDGDGDQDAGEVGIPNVRVTLTGTATDGTVYNLVTYTDANGGYVFPDLKPSNVSGYTVTVDSTSLPAGLAANPTYDENGIGTPHTTTVILGNGVEHTTADFGYNWSSPAETNTPGGGSTGAIGDRVWIDTDGDGNQDPNEIGIQGVTVQLVTAGPDGLFGTGDDVVAATTVTDHNGNYIFDGLAAGAYVVNIPTPPAGYTQTGDPDETLDDQTTDPIVLGPGDVFLDADFGYQPTGATGSIGDLVWLDADRDNVKDASEPGIAGVTVSLIKDLDGDGVWDIGEPIIATDITDENGIYGFTGLPITDGTGTDDYIVWVNDTRNVLGELSPTYDVRDGGTQANPTTGVVTGLQISAVTNLTSTPVTDADFAYAPPGHDANEGLIGDTIFYDRDADGVFDPGEGIEGVTVQLLQGATLIATTTTDENGNYSFGGLPAGTYTVQVITSSLPNAGIGLTNTVDPDGGTANQSSVTIGTGEINLLQDFGYRDTTNPNAIGGTIWEDRDADGSLEGGETDRFAGVTVTLYEDSNGNGVLDGGDAVVGTTTTDSNGDYLFSNLPDGSYLVDVTDDANHLNGYWHSVGNQSQATDNESKNDPFLLSVSGGQTVTTVDFGYYRDPAVIGNFVWHDLDGDGIQDGGEPGIAGVEVVLTITWPNSGGTTTLRTVTDSNGFYSFGNLLLDEDHNGVGGDEPTFVVSVPTAPSGYEATLANQGGDDALDSDLASGVSATPIEGTTDNTYDFGYAVRDLTVDTQCFDYTGTSPFTIATDTVTHAGGSALDATGLTLVHTFGSAAVTYSSFSASATNGGTTNCTPSGTMVTCTLTGTFEPGDTWSVDFIVTYPGGSQELLSNEASVSATEADGVSANNTDMCNSTLPVSIAHVTSERDGRTVRIEWSTATETGNVGFNVYAVTETGRVRLNDELIPSNAFDSTEPQTYSFEAEGVTAERFVIEDVAWNAAVRAHGTFELGQEYGRAIDLEPIDWPAIRQEHEAAGQARMAVERDLALDAAQALIDRAVEAAELDVDTGVQDEPGVADAQAGVDSRGPGAGARAADPRLTAFAKVAVSADGLYRVTYEDLLAAGYNLLGVRAADIAVVHKGEPVAIDMQGGPSFGAGSAFTFHGRTAPTLYSETTYYHIALDRDFAVRIPTDKKAAPTSARPPAHYMATAAVERQRQYAVSSPNGDPWIDSSMLTYRTPQLWRYAVDLDQIARVGTAGTLTVDTWGVTDWPGEAPDHHLHLDFNGSVVASEYFDGLTEHVITVDVPNTALLDGSNSVNITLLGDTGYQYDLVALDGYRITYPRRFVAIDGGLRFTTAGQAIEVQGLSSPNVVVYRLDAGGPVRMQRVEIRPMGGGVFTARFAGTTSQAEYIVRSVETLGAPAIEPVRAPVDLLAGPADYVVVAHGTFIDGIQPLVDHHTASGLSVKVVDVLDIYEHYGWGEVGAQPIADYLAAMRAAHGTEYVLLVGGDTYDYLGYLGTSMSFVPTPYRRTGSNVAFAPVDPAYADVDGDGFQDLAIGRLPVRTEAELDSIVAKTLAYASKDYGGTAVFAADDYLGQMSDQLAGSLPGGWGVERAYLDTAGVASARQTLLAAMNAGKALTVFTGHSGPTTWTFKGLFNTTDAANLQNHGRPTLVVQWGCWNTYHVLPAYNTLGHRFMLSGDRGAAAVLGATTLTSMESEQRLGSILTPRLAEPGMTVGAAVRDAKRALAATDPDRDDVLLGWSLLGDPAARVTAVGD